MLNETSKAETSPERAESDFSDATTAYTASLVQSAAKAVLKPNTSFVSDDEENSTGSTDSFGVSTRKVLTEKMLESLQTETIPALPSEQDRKRFIGCLAAILASSYEYDFADEEENFTKSKVSNDILKEEQEEIISHSTHSFDTSALSEEDLPPLSKKPNSSDDLADYDNSESEYLDKNSYHNKISEEYDEIGRDDKDNYNLDESTENAEPEPPERNNKQHTSSTKSKQNNKNHRRKLAQLGRSGSLNVFNVRRDAKILQRSLRRHRKRRYQVLKNILMNAARFLSLEEDVAATFLPLLSRIMTPAPKSKDVVNKDDMNENFYLLGIDDDNFIWAFLEELSPGAGFRCMSMLLLEHLLRGEEGYDSRVRRAYKKLAVLLLLFDGEYHDRDDCKDLAEIEFATRKFEALEREIASQILNLSGNARQKHKTLKKGTKESGLTREHVLKGLKIGSAGILAGTLFAVTGGFAAPGIAAGVAALAGTTAASTAAVVALTSTAAVTTIFGVGGAGLAAYKMHRRQRGLTEFEFQRESGKGEDIREAELCTTICISGWIRDQCDFQRPWGVQPTTPPIRNLLELLQRFYAVHKPGNILRCEEILARWKGKESKLFGIIRQKYGRSPVELFPLSNGPRDRASLTVDQKEVVEQLFLELGYISPVDEFNEVSPEKKSQGWHDQFMKRTLHRNTSEKKSSMFNQSAPFHFQDGSSRRGHERQEADEVDPNEFPSHIKTVWDYKNSYGGELYTVRFESNLLLELGDSVEDLAVETVAYGTQTVLLQSALLGVLVSAVAIPTALIRAANMIDGSWTLAIERSDEAGIELAKSLLFSQAGRRPVTLIGYSMAARTIYSCLKELARYQEKWEEMRETKTSNDSINMSSQNLKNSRRTQQRSQQLKELEKMREPASILEDVILMGMPNHLSLKSWYLARQLIAGRLVNCYSKKDLILTLMFRYKRLTGGLRPVCGTCAINVPGVENYDVSDLISGHAQYCTAVGEILRRIQHGQPIRAPHNTAPIIVEAN